MAYKRLKNAQAGAREPLPIGPESTVRNRRVATSYLVVTVNATILQLLDDEALVLLLDSLKPGGGVFELCASFVHDCLRGVRGVVFIV